MVIDIGSFFKGTKSALLSSLWRLALLSPQVWMVIDLGWHWKCSAPPLTQTKYGHLEPQRPNAVTMWYQRWDQMQLIHGTKGEINCSYNQDSILKGDIKCCPIVVWKLRPNVVPKMRPNALVVPKVRSRYRSFAPGLAQGRRRAASAAFSSSSSILSPPSIWFPFFVFRLFFFSLAAPKVFPFNHYWMFILFYITYW